MSKHIFTAPNLHSMHFLTADVVMINQNKFAIVWECILGITFHSSQIAQSYNKYRNDDKNTRKYF